MSQERIEPSLKGISAIILGIAAISFWGIHYFLILDESLIISVIFPCIVFGIILAISGNPGEKEQSLDLFQKLGLVVNLGCICYLILSSILIEILS